MTTDDLEPVENTSYLTRPGGRLAYDVDGVGPLVVLVPGMGDLRSTYRFLAPALRSAGYAVACADLRGHGDSDATFDSYGDVETAGDIVALIEELGGPAVVAGNSMGAASAVLVAAQRPDLVSSLVLIGPFVRDAHMSPVQRGLLRLAMATPWAAASWKAYLPKLYAGRRPTDFDEYRRRIVAALRRPGHARAFSVTTRTSHAAAAARLDDVSASTLVVMGEQDPDFPDPQLEGEWIASTLHGQLVMVPEAGHYPQSQRPDVTGTAVLGFLETVTRHA
ncbi:MAG: alpha/beta fold hydrolase [Acidimicrobiales bacterium]|jgi:pimeloyl-ACP methyl ester carboxylesterase